MHTFSEECNLAEGKGSARRAAEQTGQKTGYISGAQRGKQARGSSNQGSAYLLPKEARRGQGGKRKGRGEGAAGAAGEGDKHRNKILSPALARCGKHCATGCRSSGSVPTAGGRSVDASRDTGVVRNLHGINCARSWHDGAYCLSGALAGEWQQKLMSSPNQRNSNHHSV